MDIKELKLPVELFEKNEMETEAELSYDRDLEMML